MKTRRHIKPGTKVGLKLTAAERKLILEDLICQDDNYIQVIRDTPARQPVQFTLDDWDGLSGYIAAEANHAEDKNLEKKLDALFARFRISSTPIQTRSHPRLSRSRIRTRQRRFPIKLWKSLNGSP